jgi:hypothetical protein
VKEISSRPLYDNHPLAQKKGDSMKHIFKTRKLLPVVIGTCMMTILCSCGGDDDNGSSRSRVEEEQEQEGEYEVVLSPLNSDLTGVPSGSGEFSLTGDDFRAVMNVSMASGTGHIQLITTGSACPDNTSDTNGDGVIDVVEAINVTGAALVPLDRDLSSQSAGGFFPDGANYNYDESVSYSLMLSDLKLPDSDDSDIFVKLGADEDLNLEGRTVLVHGIPDSQELPQTVSGAADLSAQATLPILCGVINRAVTSEVEESETAE